MGYTLETADEEGKVSFIKAEVTVAGTDVAGARNRGAAVTVGVGDFIDVTATETEGVYCVTMPNDKNLNLHITATFPEKPYLTGVSYIDPTKTGNAQNATTPAGTHVYILDGTETVLGENGKETWYISNTTGNGLAYNSQIMIMGNVHLILADNSSMTVTIANDHPIYIYQGSADNPNRLHIYGQDGTTEGKLTATSESGDAINGNFDTELIINGGIINATGSSGIKVTGSGTVTINGGNVSASGESVGIKAGGDIILGWTNSTDRIYASNFSAGGTISISDGKAFTDGTNVYTSATSSDDLEALTNVTLQPVTGVTLTDDGSGLTASLDPSSEEEVNIPVPVEVDHVEIDRLFENGKAATVYLPFSIEVSKMVGGTFHTFVNVDETTTPLWTVIYSEPLANDATLQANTPYIFLPDDEHGGKITVNNGNTPVSVCTAGENTAKDDAAKWEFIGTYKPIKWLSDPSADGYNAERAAEIGSVYGFAAEDLSVGTTKYAVGQFVKVGSGAHINPMRAYLKRTSTNGVRGANGNATQPLPQTMKVVIRSANGETTTVGTLTLEYETGDWFSIDGHKLSGKPSKKGMYIHEGNKVLVP